LFGVARQLEHIARLHYRYIFRADLQSVPAAAKPYLREDPIRDHSQGKDSKGLHQMLQNATTLGGGSFAIEFCNQLREGDAIGQGS